MSLFNRLLAIALALLLIAGGLFVVGSACSWWLPVSLAAAPALERLAGLLHPETGSAGMAPLVGGGAAAAAGLVLMLLECRPSRRGVELVLARDGTGTISVSLAGLRRLSDHVVGGIQGVESVVSEASPTGKGLAFRCRVVVKPDASVPLLAKDVRERLSQAVLQHTGQEVFRIHVHSQVNTGGLGRRRVR